jgi:tRNA1(Val) A37 N6-methylase TrmN6
MQSEPPAATVDAFHRGRFWLTQPKDSGHRAGVDALILAASLPRNFAGALADFGAGAGAAGLAVASRCSDARVTLVENAPAMAAFARLTLADPRNAALAGRSSVLVADVTLSGRDRAACGLADNAFDHVIMNPPFNETRDRATPDDLRRAAHVMTDGLFEAWLRSAAAVVKPRGGVSIIARPTSLAPILAALEGRFGGAEIVPIHPRPAAPAIRIVVRARRASRAQLVLCPPLILHEAAGNGFTPRADAICNGEASLFGD